MRPHFDEAFYLGSYPEVRRLPTTPLEHFASIGWLEGKDPAPWFSTRSYLERYADVRASGGNPFLHYVLYGQAEGRATGPDDGPWQGPTKPAFSDNQIALMRSQFDPDYYLEQYPDVRSAGIDPLQHYLEIGWEEGRRPNPRFDAAIYLERNPDVRAAKINPFIHYIQHVEPMRPHFDEAFYLEKNPEVRELSITPFEHFASVGWKEGKDPAPWFSVGGYLEHYGDVRASGANPFLHYILYGRAEGRRPRPQDAQSQGRALKGGTMESFSAGQIALMRSQFDADYYLQQYPDVRSAGIDPLQHYLEIGWMEGRKPNSRFDPAVYLERNPDVRAAKVNPFVHYIQHVEPMRPHFDEAFYLEKNPEVRELPVTPLEHFAFVGWKEAKDPAPWFSVSGYLEHYADVRASGTNPFLHHILYGRAEGRLARPQDAPLRGGARKGGNIETFSADQIALMRSEFDADYYLERYPDVRAAGVDPFQHYVEIGWVERRDPNSRFVTALYLERNADVRAAKINPFLHYLQHGRMEGRAPVPERFKERTVSFTRLIATPGEHSTLRRLDATIVVPIYNGYDDVRALLANLAETLGSDTSVILVDDCSPDERIALLLAEWTARHKSWTSVRNESNGGFSVSVNRGIELASGHVVIVNSDVLLPSGWLPRLMAPILASPATIASVTPFSNNSNLTGFPAARQEADLYLGASLDAIDRAFASLPPLDIDIASGIGFCMALNRRALDRIGSLEPEVYGRGYFEDTDWCQRAVLAGFRNVAANVFVHHKVGSASYGMQLRKDFSARNRTEFLKRFPFYPDVEQHFLQHDPLFEVRAAVQAILWRERANGAVLILDHLRGGGANHFSERLRRRLVAEGKLVVTLRISGHDVNWILSSQEETVTVRDVLSAAVWKVIDRLGISELVVNGVHGSTDIKGMLAELTNLADKISITFYVHDYIAVCPSIFLLNNKEQFCGVPVPFECQKCLLTNNSVEFPVANIVVWRRQWGLFLQRVNEIRVFSESSRALLSAAYPWLADRTRITMVDPDYRPPVRPVKIRPKTPDRTAPGPFLHVGIMGVLNLHKGPRIVARLATYVQEHALPVRLSVFGLWHGDTKPSNLSILGPYKQEQISERVEQNGIDVMLFPSIGAETYSYTLSEIFGMELPVVALRLAAQGDRVQDYPWGVVVDDPSPEAIYAALCGAYELRCGKAMEVA